METARQPLKVDVYFDYSCPWCYIGFKRYHEVGAKYGAHAQAITRYGKTVELAQHPVGFADCHVTDSTSSIWELVRTERTITRTCSTRILRGSYNKRRWGSDAWVAGMKQSGEKDGALFRNWK